jgi:hypothetical protein
VPLLAGVAGMNVNFKADAFFDSGLFWVVVVAIVAIAFFNPRARKNPPLDLAAHGRR